jgi:hypothetical protein
MFIGGLQDFFIVASQIIVCMLTMPRLSNVVVFLQFVAFYDFRDT